MSEHNSTATIGNNRSELLYFCVYSPVTSQEAVVLHDYELDIQIILKWIGKLVILLYRYIDIKDLREI